MWYVGEVGREKKEKDGECLHSGITEKTESAPQRSGSLGKCAVSEGPWETEVKTHEKQTKNQTRAQKRHWETGAQGRGNRNHQ